MTTFCLTELREATKGILKKTDVEDLEKRIKERAAQRVRENQEERATALRKSVDDVIEEERKKTAYRKKVAAINIIKNKEVFKNADRFANPIRGIVSELDGVQGKMTGIRKGAGRLQQANRIKLLQDFYANLREADVFEDFNDIKDERALASELHSPGTIDDPITQKIAKAVKIAFENTRRLLNRAGANIPSLAEYIARQTHNPEKLARAAKSYTERKQLDVQLFRQFKGDVRAIRAEKARLAFSRWLNFIRPKLDIGRTFGDIASGEIDTRLKQIYDNIVSGEHQVFTEDEEGFLKFRRSFSSSSKLNAKRVLHFKDGGSWYDYQQEYGNGSLHDQLVKQLWDSGGQLGVMEKFGPSARSVYESVKEQLIAKNKDIKNIRKKFRHADWTMDELEGKTRGAPDNMLGKVVMGFKMVRGMNLGSIWLSSLPDIGLSGSKMRSFGGSYLEGEFQAIKSFATGRQRLKELGSRFGIWSNSTIGASLSRFSSVDSPFSGFAKLNSYVNKFNLMGHHDDSIRLGWAAGAGKTLGDLADSKFADIPIGVRQTLNVHGIGDAEWDLMRHPSNRIKVFPDEYMVAPDLVREFSKESIAQYLKKPVSELTSNDIFNVKEDMKTDWYNYFADEADDVIPNPSPSSMAWINQGTRGDEAKGVMLRILGQFKSWNIESTRRTLGRYIYGGGAENIYDAFANGKADLWGLSEFILQQTKWGYISATAVNLSRGLEPPNPLDPKTWLESLDRGGGLGIYMGTMEQAWGKYSRDVGDIFIPPVVGPMRDTTRFLAALFTGNAPLFAATKLAQKNIPALNLFYTRLAFDHLLLFGLMEKSKPGYLRRIESFAKKDGDKYWLSPSERTNFF